MIINTTSKQLWASIAYAHRKNKSLLVCEDVASYYDTRTKQRVKAIVSNSTYVTKALRNEMVLNNKDYQTGNKIHEYYKEKLTLKSLMNNCDLFDRVIYNIINVTDWQNYSLPPHHFHMLVSLPSIWLFDTTTDENERVMSTLNSKHIGNTINTSVDINIVVFTCKYVDVFCYNSIIARTEDDNIVIFKSRRSLKPKKKFRIRGVIDDFLDRGITRLERVKIIEPK